MKRFPSFTVMFILGVLLCSACGQQYSGKEPPKAIKGVLDLRDWNFEKDGPLRLNGEWELYWERLLDGQSTRPNDGFYPIPDRVTWRGHTLPDGRGLSHKGYGTFRLRVLMPENTVGSSDRSRNVGGAAFRSPDLAIGMGRSFSSDQLVIQNANGKSLAQPLLSGIFGVNATTAIPAWPQNITSLQPNKEMILLWRVSNFHNYYGGPFKSPILGSFEAVQNGFLGNFSKDFFIMGILSVMGIYHFILFILHPKERSPFWFAVFCMQVISFTLVLEGYLNRLFTDTLLFEIHEKTFLGIGLYLAPVTFLFFIKSLFPKEGVPKIERIWITLFCLVSCLCGLMPLNWIGQDYINKCFLILILPFTIYVVFILIKSMKGANPLQAKVLLSGGVILSFCMFHDILIQISIISFTFHWVPTGLCLFILFQAVTIAINNRSDYQARIKAEQAAVKNLKKADKLKDEFLANTSHELSTPLNGIIGLAESLIDGVTGKLPQATDHNLEMIVQSGKRLSNLVNDILDFSKMKNQDLHLRQKPVDIKSTAEVVLALSQPLLGHKPVSFVNRLPADLPLVEADEDRLQQILLNLVGNAVKFTHEGEITLSAQEETGWVTVSVQDTGIGIQKEKQAHIFEPFEQADGSAAREYGGTGLGLSITKKLVELHGGTLSVESKKDPDGGSSRRPRGSTFTFTLPIAQDQTQTKIQEERSVRTLTPDSPREDDPTSMESPLVEGKDIFKILVVDDEPVNIQVLKNQLQSRNYQVLTAHDGFEALDILRREKDQDTLPDLMVLDLMMPRMNGYEVSRTVRETHDASALPIVMLTAKNRVGDLVEGLRSGANDYLTKPFAKEELLARVESQLKLKEAAEAMKEAERAKMELLTARTVQKLLIPKEDPRLEEIEIASFYQSASETGGDWYDYRYHPDVNTLEVLIGDVTGHGVPAAIITGITDSVYSTVHQLRLGSEEVGRSDAHVLHPNYYMEVLNEVLYQTIEGEYTVTLYCSVIDLTKKEMLYASASHKHCYIWREEGFPTKKGSKTILL